MAKAEGTKIKIGSYYNGVRLGGALILHLILLALRTVTFDQIPTAAIKRLVSALQVTKRGVDYLTFSCGI